MYRIIRLLILFISIKRHSKKGFDVTEVISEDMLSFNSYNARNKIDENRSKTFFSHRHVSIFLNFLYILNQKNSFRRARFVSFGRYSISIKID